MVWDRAVPEGLPDPKKLGIYFALAQVGMEMAAPVVIGILLDQNLGWTPWATVVGAVVGFVGGLVHLVAILNRSNEPGSHPRHRDEP
jgi:hypothetical protein